MQVWFWISLRETQEIHWSNDPKQIEAVMRTNHANAHNYTVIGKALTIIIIRCVSDQSERLACHVTRVYAAFTVYAQLAHLTQAWSAFTTLQDVGDIRQITSRM